eukprot:CAMPEP_0118953546 /NCGR_PEP_ID=MMETSP1169-20130426/56747_1 /TAXON_ID=36882 /ORGANISM="Pyramimonas obovata, Strain CCMP722" /LENGTH=309 /DNA_ID=CAMNT_0006901033 /DNA_START=144 /DNA_END=1069 /DNA_ORIENTATION=-
MFIILEEKVSDCYVLGEEVGFGAYSTVYKATSLTEPGGTEVAVKVLRRKVEGNDEQVLQREIKMLQRVAQQIQPHPTFAHTLRVFEESEQVAIVMELCTGGTLLELIEEKEQLSEIEAGKVTVQLLEAVRALHAAGVVHRDIKMENVLLAGAPDDLRLKLVDFGTAVLEEEACSGDGIVVGTMEYASPEALNADYPPACDLWAIGVTLFILLSGGLPFESEADSRLGRFAFEEEEWAEVPEGPKDLLRQLFVVDFSRRITAEEALQHPWVQHIREVAGIPAMVAPAPAEPAEEVEAPGTPPLASDPSTT